MKDTIKALCEKYGIEYNTFYSRLRRAVKNGEPYPYPCVRPYSQYIPLMENVRGYDKSGAYAKPKPFDLDKAWERVCERLDDPISREISYLRLCQKFYPKDISKEIEVLYRVHETANSEDCYTTFRKENGLFHESGYVG